LPPASVGRCGFSYGCVRKEGIDQFKELWQPPSPHVVAFFLCCSPPGAHERSLSRPYPCPLLPSPQRALDSLDVSLSPLSPDAPEREAVPVAPVRHLAGFSPPWRLRRLTLSARAASASAARALPWRCAPSGRREPRRWSPGRCARCTLYSPRWLGYNGVARGEGDGRSERGDSKIDTPTTSWARLRVTRACKKREPMSSLGVAFQSPAAPTAIVGRMTTTRRPHESQVGR